MVEENVIKHLEFIQDIIARMGNNSFLLKGWTITLVSALFALAAQNANEFFAVLAFFPVLAFWILDAYYLRQERLFRTLYNFLRVMNEEEIRFIGPFSLDTANCTDKVDNLFRTMTTKTIFIYYGTISATIMIMTLIMKFVR